MYTEGSGYVNGEGVCGVRCEVRPGRWGGWILKRLADASLLRLTESAGASGRLKVGTLLGGGRGWADSSG